MDTDKLIACPDCDALYHTPPISGKSTAYCTRCGATLYRQPSGKLAYMVAFSLTALIALLVANSFPIVEVTSHGLISRTTLPGAAMRLWKDGQHVVAVIVIGSTVVLPLLDSLALLWLFIPLCRDRQPRGFAPILRTVQAIRPWCMIEVFMLGALVTLVKLSSVARIIPEAALFALGFFTVLLTLLLSFDLRQLWVLAPVTSQRGADTVTRPSLQAVPPMRQMTARDGGLVSCLSCNLLCRQPSPAMRNTACCPRCGAWLQGRRTHSILRSWVLLTAAAVLYIPATLLPIMHTRSLTGTQDSTIMSGILYFWQQKEPLLASIIFVASIVVPLFKLIMLSLLVLSVQLKLRWKPLLRARLYRFIEKIGRWSMLDIFVITLSVALVNFRSFATITPGQGALAFACVVVLTMLASLTFDPRLIWDPLDRIESQHD